MGEATRKRPRPAEEVAPGPDSKRVYPGEATQLLLWDLDETLIIFNSLLMSTFEPPGQRPKEEGLQLGIALERELDSVLDNQLLYNRLSGCELVNIADLSQEGGFTSASGTTCSLEAEASLLSCVQNTANLYESGTGFGGAHNPPGDIVGSLVQEVDVYTGGWLSAARQVLGRLQSTMTHNCLVTNTELIPAMVKMRFFGLQDFFKMKAIYSSAVMPKFKVFERIIMEHASENPDILCIGDGKEEEAASIQYAIPFIPIKTMGDLLRVQQHVLGEADAVPEATL